MGDIGHAAAGAVTDGAPGVDALADAACDELLAACDAQAPHSPLLADRFARAGLAVPRLLRCPGPDAIRDARLSGLFAHWRALAPAVGAVPPVACLDPIELRPWLGHLMLLEVVDGGRDFRYRVYGTAIADRAGFDLTGKYTSDLMALTGTGGLIPLFFTAVYRCVLAERTPWYSEHQAPATVTAATWRRLILPFAEPAGRVTRLLVGNVPQDADRRG